MDFGQAKAWKIIMFPESNRHRGIWDQANPGRQKNESWSTVEHLFRYSGPWIPVGSWTGSATAWEGGALHRRSRKSLGSFEAVADRSLEAHAKCYRWHACLGHFTRPPLNTGQLLGMQTQNGKKPHEAKQVMMDMVVRWLSTANTLERSLLLQVVIV